MEPDHCLCAAETALDNLDVDCAMDCLARYEEMQLQQEYEREARYIICKLRAQQLKETS